MYHSKDDRKTEKDGEYSIDHVTSKDGTQVGYRQYGKGNSTSIILIQGAIGTPEKYHDLASFLAVDFTVYVPERRGRPLSPCKYTHNHCIERDLEDVDALITRSGAKYIFGLSSGGVIALEAARTIASIDSAIIFEAPLHISPRKIDLDSVARYYKEIDNGDIPNAMISALIASGFAPPNISRLPRFVIKLLLSLYLRYDATKKSEIYTPIREMVPTMQFDYNIVTTMQDRVDTFKEIKKRVLLMSCKDSPIYIRESAQHLASIILNSQSEVSENMDHSGPWNAPGGRPERVAASIRHFIKS